MRKTVLAASLAAAALTAAPAAPAAAAPPPWAPAHGYRDHHDRRHAHRYDRHGRYASPVAITRRDHVWRGRDGRYYCRRDNGTTGLVIGAALGALAGNQIDGGRDRTLGAILGAVGGGVLGREIDRGDLKCR
jgi:uncharacterized protein YcfJ